MRDFPLNKEGFIVYTYKTWSKDDDDNLRFFAATSGCLGLRDLLRLTNDSVEFVKKTAVNNIRKRKNSLKQELKLLSQEERDQFLVICLGNDEW